ncbi:hypothetical protein DFS34DRAFT_630123 [Phlyctochytrium arcticum]|nr:hypothetical protein DFS34DRAFT_630123 [Phlyctochytrium arcticum]
MTSPEDSIQLLEGFVEEDLSSIVERSSRESRSRSRSTVCLEEQKQAKSQSDIPSSTRRRRRRSKGKEPVRDRSRSCSPGRRTLEPQSENHESDSPTQDVGRNCSICLHTKRDQMYLHPCYHSFCFDCICQWAEFRQECPECRSPIQFGVIPADGADGYEKFEFVTASDKPYRFRRPTQQDRTRYRDFYSSSSLPRNSDGRRQYEEEQEPRQTAAEAFRRYIYAHNLRVRAHPLVKKDVNPSAFIRNQALLDKLVPWIKRDLRVILKMDDVDMISDVVVAVMKRHRLDSDAAKDELVDYIGSTTSHFLQELLGFAKSSWTMDTYDNQVVYIPFESVQASTETSLPIYHGDDQSGEGVRFTDSDTWRDKSSSQRPSVDYRSASPPDLKCRQTEETLYSQGHGPEDLEECSQSPILDVNQPVECSSRSQSDIFYAQIDHCPVIVYNREICEWARLLELAWRWSLSRLLFWFASVGVYPHSMPFSTHYTKGRDIPFSRYRRTILSRSSSFLTP